MMIDRIRDFFDNLLMELVIFFLGFSLTFIKSKHQKIIIRRSLKYSFKDNSDIVFITANSGYYVNQELVTLGYIFEYLSVGAISDFLNKTYRKITITTIMSKMDFSNIEKKYLLKNIVLIGGPFHNQVTKEIMDNYKDIPFRFHESANLYFTDRNGTVNMYCPEEHCSDKSHYYEKDYALIVNIKNPWNKEKRCMLIIGCRSVGCYGAAVFLAKA